MDCVCLGVDFWGLYSSVLFGFCWLDCGGLRLVVFVWGWVGFCCLFNLSFGLFVVVFGWWLFAFGLMLWVD